MLVKRVIVQSLAMRNAGVLSRAYHDPDHRPAHMNDLPLPQGDWQEDHERKNTKYNAILLTGVVLLGTAIGLAKSTGLVRLNFSPPKSLD